MIIILFYSSLVFGWVSAQVEYEFMLHLLFIILTPIYFVKVFCIISLGTLEILNSMKC